MTYSGGPTPAAGWFPDPAGPGLRWWDGTRWTEHMHAAPFAQPHPYPYALRPFIDPHHAVREERGMARVARHLVVVYGLLLLVMGYLAQRLFDSFFTLMTRAMEMESGGQPGPELIDPWEIWGPELFALPLLNFVQLGLFAMLLVWVYRAARAGAALGIPARHSPGWAVGWWFIPFVNLWFPLQALVDVLPPDHPMRRTITGLWIAGLVGYVVGTVGLMMSMFGGGAGGVMAILGYLTIAVALALGRSVIDTVLECHEQVLAARHEGAAAPQVR